MTQRNDITRNAIRTGEPRAPRDVAINQGQVLLDTDHNEQGRLILDRVEKGTSDILGAPDRFVVQAGSDAFDLTVGGGPGDFLIAAGHGWLDGWRVENAAETKFSTQPHPPTDPDFGNQGVIALKALVRYIDPVEEPALADKALGNAQASGRTLIDWQVFPVPLPAADAESCATAYTSDAWGEISAPSTGKLAFLVEASAASIDPCSLTPEGSYSRLENLLYRIEVHDGEADPTDANADGPRFKLDKLKIKFSRRNASLLARVTKIAGSEITVTPPARDPRIWFAPGQYAEIVSVHDDLDALGALKSERLFRVSSTSDDRVVLQATGPQISATGIADDGDWFLRLWDAFSDGAGMKELALGGGGLSQKIDLGDGLAVQLGEGAAGRLRRGDYWCCAARADGTIEWPVSGGNFERLLPQGPETRYAILGTYDDTGAAFDLGDCRVPFAPLTEQLQVIALGGDGQEVLADSQNAGLVPLPFKLRVGVIRGSTPLVGETIHFRIIKGGGQLDGGGNDVTALTDANGVAETGWSLGPADPDQQVEAVRLAPGNKQTHAPIRFNGFLSRADQTSFDPANTPSLSGAFDVQTAIELLAGQAQVGCSTYVVQEGSDWVAILEAIRDGEGAAVCFQRGLYETDRTVMLAKKGHLKISGAGPGTRIVAKGVEVALDFAGCASVELCHLHVATPTSSIKVGDVEHRGGAVTISDCNDVAVIDSILQCGAGSSAQRSCLRIAGVPLAGHRATVRDCEFRTGYMQDALIISDCDQIAVRDNSFTTIARPQILDFPILVKDRGWVAKMARALVRSPYSLMPPKSGSGPIIRGRKYTARVSSAIPQSEWTAMIEADPPMPGDERSKAGFDRYVERILVKVLKQPQLLPSYEANLRNLESSLGAAAGRQLSDPVRRNLLANTVHEAEPLKVDSAPGLNSVWLDANGHSVRFESPLPASDWQVALKKSGEIGAITDYRTFRRALFRISRRLIMDESFAASLPSFGAWRDLYIKQLASVSRDAISCVGKALGKVSITGNRVVDFELGVRVATSHGKWNRLYKTKGNTQQRYVRLAARAVDVSDNQVLARTHGPSAVAPFAMMFGDADSIRVHGNELHYADLRMEVEREPFQLDYANGMRLFGHFGRLVSVKGNHVTLAKRAILMTWRKTQGVPDTYWPYNWIFADNMGNWQKDENLAVQLFVPDSSKVELRNNRPPF